MLPFGNTKSPEPSGGGLEDDDAAGDDEGSTAVGSNGEDDDDGKATLPDEAETKTFNRSEGPKPLGEGNKDELDPLAPQRVAENTEPNEAAEAAATAPQD